MEVLETERIEQIFIRFAQRNPHPQSELKWKNPFTLLVAVLLSAQATDVGVNRATKALFEKVDSPSDMLQLGEESLKEMIKTINYYPTKAKRIIALSKILCEQHGGDVPFEKEALEALPGIGRKSANVVLNVAFGKPTIAVDTHVLRVSNRLHLSFADKPCKVEEDLLLIVPERFKMTAHHHLILHGRYICKARAPSCDECFLSDLCPKDIVQKTHLKKSLKWSRKA